MSQLASQIPVNIIVSLLWLTIICPFTNPIPPPSVATNTRLSGPSSSSPSSSLSHQHHNISLPESLADMKIECFNNEIEMRIETLNGRPFNGMIYPKGLSRNSSCMSEFIARKSPIIYKVPLHSCNTMSSYLNDGSLEYFNTIMVQPHLKLVTNQGRGFHVRCRYDIRDNIIVNDHSTSFERIQARALVSNERMPVVTMRILQGTLEAENEKIAQQIRIGDPLTLTIAIEPQPKNSLGIDKNFERAGLQIADCLVRDGIGLSEQQLTNQYGCPYDYDILGQFAYFDNYTKAKVPFNAHKFPYTKAVYYNCHVRLCSTSESASSGLPSCKRIHKMQMMCSKPSKQKRDLYDERPAAVFEVFSGLFVNEESKQGDPGSTSKSIGRNYFDDIFTEKTGIDYSAAICVSQRKFAIAMVLVGLFLIFVAIIAILCIISKRTKRNRHKPISRTTSSIYSSPNTNTASNTSYSQSR